MLADERHAADRRIDILSLVDQLQEVVETCPRLPLSDRIVASSDLLLDLVDAIRNTLPHAVIEADRVLEERRRLIEDAREEADQLLESAREESDRLIESAREQSKFMLQEHHIVKAAEMRAERLLNQARREADEIMESADEYIQKLFSRFEDEAMRLAGEIRKAAASRVTD